MKQDLIKIKERLLSQLLDDKFNVIKEIDNYNKGIELFLLLDKYIKGDISKDERKESE